jgi:ribosome-associated protein
MTPLPPRRENPPEERNEEKSRSRKKRESTALQLAGEKLAALAPTELAALDLPEDLAAAISDLRKMRTRESRRRQMQYIGRLMRETQRDQMRPGTEEI